MHAGTNEGSPLLSGVAMRGGWGDAGRTGSGRPLLGESSRDKSRRAGRQDAPQSSPTFLRRNWRVSAGAAGVLMFAMALAGLVAIFNTIQSERTPRDTWTVEMKGAGGAGGSPPAAAKEGRQRAPSNSGGGGVEKGVGAPQKEEKKVNGSGKQWPKADHPPASSGGGGEVGKPNVFFIMIDDLGYNDIGYQSTDLGKVTPNLDKLAAGGVKIPNYYSMQICTPARASLMTGRHVMRYGLQYSVIQPGAPWGLPLTEKIFPQYMKDAGYETHMIGKWHIGSYQHDYIPSQRGFDTYMGYLNDEEMYWTHQSWSAKMNGRKFFDFGFGNATGYYDIIDRPLPDHERDGSISDKDDDHSQLSPTTTLASSTADCGSTLKFKGQYSTQVFQDRAIDILEGKSPHDEEPLFMYLAHQAVHDPLGLPPDDSFSDEELAVLAEIELKTEGHLRTRFAKVLMYLDHTIGELLEYLETNGWMENSIIVVASDNGGCPSIGGSNYPLRGIKHSYWEGGTRVPAFVYSTSHIPESQWGTEYEGLMHVVDWLPTIASGAEVFLDGVGGHGVLDGIDHWAYILGEETGSPRTEMMYNFDPYMLWTNDEDEIGNPEFNLAQGAFRSGKYKYMANAWCSGWYTFDRDIQNTDPLTDLTSQCDGNACSDCGQGCTKKPYDDFLFDLEADPREETNLVEVYPEVAEALRDRWVEVAFSEFANSSYVNIDHQAYLVWAKFNWWMVPWFDQVGEFHFDSTSGPSSDSTTTSSSSSSGKGVGSSWTSSVSSTCDR